MGPGLVPTHGISVRELVGQGKSGVPGVPVNYVRETAQERKETGLLWGLVSYLNTVET